MNTKQKKRWTFAIVAILTVYLVLIRSYTPEMAIRKIIWMNLQWKTALQAEITKMPQDNLYAVNGWINSETYTPVQEVVVKKNGFLGYVVVDTEKAP
ncbi:hypothetical protein [Marinicrinis sediminis]|uniref:Uncharacterized protein n=1 Tax=Marinicrinis sediminis TaxID=1652465 RepID=A0ABW5RFI5_9BACL